MRSSLEIYTLATGQTRVVLQTDDLIEAPNWHKSGWLLVNGAGRLYRVPLAAPALIPIDTGPLVRCNNDHGFTRDGAAILFSCHRDMGSEIFHLPLSGGPATLLSPQAPSWFHGTSPDGNSMTYAAARDGKRTVDIYSKRHDRAEVRLTFGEGHSDGPDYSADGRHIFYNCDRSGHAQIWVMQADGSDQRALFSDNHVNWFPHPSPDGRHLLYLAYPPGTQGHPRDLQVALCLAAPDGQNRRHVVAMTGGQGSINTPCWSPDSTAFGFVRYVLRPAEPQLTRA